MTDFSPEYPGDTPNREWVRNKIRERFGEEEVRQIAHAAHVRYIRDLMPEPVIWGEFCGIVAASRPWSKVHA